LLLTAALASLVFTLTIQQQNVAAFNDKNNQFVFNQHSHTQISEDHGILATKVLYSMMKPSILTPTSTHTEEKHLKKDLRLIPSPNLLTTTSNHSFSVVLYEVNLSPFFDDVISFWNMLLVIRNLYTLTFQGL
jgi:hypothetical protein